MKAVKLISAALALAATVQAAPAMAGVYSDDLGKCLVESTTAQDRKLLVKWMFAMAGSHADVRDISAVTPAMMDKLNKSSAELFMNLLTGPCKDRATKAVSFEGQVAFHAAFQTLGQVAGKELFSDPGVTANMSGLLRYIDEKRLAPIFQNAIR